MKLDDLKVGWKAEVEPINKKIGLTNIVKSLKKETTKLDRSVKRRDFLEISIAFLLIPFWVWGLFYSASLIQASGFSIAILACLFIPYKMHKAKQVDAPKDDSLLAFLSVEKIKLENQKALLESIVLWYIGPLMLAIVLITAGGTVNEDGIPQINTTLTVYYFFCSLLSIAVYLLNKRGAKKQFAPVLKKVNLQIKELKDLNQASE